VGAAFVRDADVLTRAFTEGEAAYLDAFAHDPSTATSQFDLIGGTWADTSMELSAPPRGVRVWAVLREIGRRGVAARVERDTGFARHIADRVRADNRLELLCDAQLSIVCFRYRPPAGMDGNQLTDAIMARLRRDTPFIPTTTVIDGALAIRPCFVNPRTRLEHVDGLVDAVLQFGDDLAGHRGGGA
jgi:aromatic-L-amino-acid/L-tryptophan decarboxylase